MADTYVRTMFIEDTIHDVGLPVNTIAMLNRMIDILRNNKTNCASNLNDQDDELKKYKKVLWLVNQQVYGQLGIIDMSEEWDLLTDFKK